MKYRLMDLLVCPHCKEGLKLEVFSEGKTSHKIKPGKPVCSVNCSFRKAHANKAKPGDCIKCFSMEIVSGILTCKCGRWYPIIKGIPRMLPDSLRDDHLNIMYRNFLEEFRDRIPKNISREMKSSDAVLKEKTLKSFGFQWNRFSEMMPEFRENFLRYIHPLKPSFFDGRKALDIGCGFGRHTYYSAEFGAEVVGLDLSHAVDAAYRNVKGLPMAYIVQGDAYNLPLRNDFDFIFSIGVIHHLPDPKAGYLSLVNFAKRGASIFIWVYGREGRWFKVNVVGRFRRLTRRMPHKTLYYLCYLPAGMYQISNDLYNFFNRGPTKGIAKMFPFKDYARFPFRVKHADAFDLLATPEDEYYTKKEMESWLREAGLKNTWVTSIWGKSWRVYGEKH